MSPLPKDFTMLPVLGFPGYTCDEEGNVWSRGRTLKPWKASRGHRKVGLYREGKRYDRYVHHLILETFVGSRPPGAAACHKDDDKANNRLDNLRWNTFDSNVRDAIRNGKQGGRPAHKGGYKRKGTGIAISRGSRRPGAKLREEDIPEIFRLRSHGWTQKAIGNYFGVSQPIICDILNDRAWVHAPQG